MQGRAQLSCIHCMLPPPLLPGTAPSPQSAELRALCLSGAEQCLAAASFIIPFQNTPKKKKKKVKFPKYLAPILKRQCSSPSLHLVKYAQPFCQRACTDS